MRILIVEDEALTALALTIALQAHGHEVVGPAATSKAALKLSQDESPELAFVDIDLEATGAGLAVARHLYERCQCAVILTTGRPELARECECALGLMSKPYNCSDAALATEAAKSIITGKTPPRSSMPASLELLNASRVSLRRSLDPILLVEDHPSDAELTIAALEKCRIRNPVIVARDGIEAIEYLDSKADLQRPAVVLLDIKMPRMDGLELLKRLRERAQFASLPIVMLTASNHESDVRYCDEYGASHYVVKPSSLVGLAMELDRLTAPLSGIERQVAEV
jgi:CheY-like chemotaxis protein